MAVEVRCVVRWGTSEPMYWCATGQHEIDYGVGRGLLVVAGEYACATHPEETL